jgi:hypothetical protein
MSLSNAKLSTRIPALLLGLTLAACGGGGGGGSTASGGGSNNPPVTTNAAPTIQGQPASSVVSAQSYSFQPSATDSNGDTLSFTAANLPAWASLNSATGRISGTPGAADVGTYDGISITVSDGRANASLGPFSITVSEVASGTATLSWMPPTTNSDGTVLTNLAGYEVRYGQDADELSNKVSLTNASLSIYMVENLSAGTWYFAVLAVNSSGVTSSFSNVASKTIG